MCVLRSLRVVQERVVTGAGDFFDGHREAVDLGPVGRKRLQPLLLDLEGFLKSRNKVSRDGIASNSGNFRSRLLKASIIKITSRAFMLKDAWMSSLHIFNTALTTLHVSIDHVNGYYERKRYFSVTLLFMREHHWADSAHIYKLVNNLSNSSLCFESQWHCQNSLTNREACDSSEPVWSCSFAAASSGRRSGFLRPPRTRRWRRPGPESRCWSAWPPRPAAAGWPRWSWASGLQWTSSCKEALGLIHTMLSIGIPNYRTHKWLRFLRIRLRQK